MRSTIYTLNKVAIICGVILLAFMASGDTVYAQVLDVQFEQSPLFNESNVIPGSSVSRIVTVTNNGSEVEAVYTSTENSTSTGLADLMDVRITDSASNVHLATTTFMTFFTADPVGLGTLNAGEARTYIFTASLDDSAGSGYQNTSMSFDLVVGFEGGEFVTDQGGGGNGSDDDEEELPEGLVAGAGTSTTPFSFADSVIEPVTNYFSGLILGENASTDEVGEVAESVDEVDAPDEPNRMSSPVAVFLDEEYCTLWWLLLLIAISFSWSAIANNMHPSGAMSVLMKRSMIMSGVYAVSVLLVFMIGALETLWWLFAGAWVVAVALEYRAHHALALHFGSALRNMYYGGTSALLILTSFLFDFPCLWWPFFLVLAVSALLYFFDA